MNARFRTLTALLGTLLLTAGVHAAPPPPAPAQPERELVIVVADALRKNSSSFNLYERIARVFTDVFERRKWPLKINTERFGANSSHETELRVFFQSIKTETIDDLTFRAWIILEDHGKTTDFGIVKFQYYPRAGAQTDDRLDDVVAGAARIVADKIEPILFPKSGPPNH